MEWLKKNLMFLLSYPYLTVAKKVKYSKILCNDTGNKFMH